MSKKPLKRYIITLDFFVPVTQNIYADIRQIPVIFTASDHWLFPASTVLFPYPWLP